MKKMIFVGVFLMGLLSHVFAQGNPTDTTSSVKLFVITVTDGREYIGRILSDDGREVLIETVDLGRVYVPKFEIRSIVEIQSQKEIVFGEYQATGPFTTRYAFTTNALPIVKGENYALINLYGPEVHFAVTNHLNIGIMSTWIASPMVLALKYSINTGHEKVNLSIGTLMGTSGYLNAFRGFGGLHFANVTFGSRKRNLTFSGGYAYLKTGIYEDYFAPGTYFSENPDGPGIDASSRMTGMLQGPIFSIAGITPVGARASLVFDSMIGFFATERNIRTSTEIYPSYYNPNPPYEYVPGLYKHEITDGKATATALFLMPGMRFQTKENSAFQVSLAGIALYRTAGYPGYEASMSFPIPMCTWFFRF